jgi:hypothetical protein
MSDDDALLKTVPIEVLGKITDAIIHLWNVSTPGPEVGDVLREETLRLAPRLPNRFAIYIAAAQLQHVGRRLGLSEAEAEAIVSEAMLAGRASR